MADAFQPRVEGVTLHRSRQRRDKRDIRSPAVSVTAVRRQSKCGTTDYTISGAGKISGSRRPREERRQHADVGTTNDFTGKTIVQGGILSIGAENDLGNNPAALNTDQLTLDGGALQTAVSFTIDDANRGITLGNNGGEFNVIINTLTVAKAIAGGSITKTGNGTLALNAVNTYTDGSTATAGAFRANILGAYGAGPVTISGTATAYLNVAGTHTNEFNIEGIGPTEASGSFGAIRFANNSATATTISNKITLTGDAPDFRS